MQKFQRVIIISVIFLSILFLINNNSGLAQDLMGVPRLPKSKKHHLAEKSILPKTPIVMKDNIGEQFDGETLKYVLGFFPFFHAADAEISFQKDTSVKNGYIATLRAKTAGVIKLIASRKDEMISHMILSEDGKRLISTKFEKISNDGSKVKHIITEFDYEKKLVNWKTYKKDVVDGEGTRSIPENTHYDDPLCAFFNFRYEAYGDIEMGKFIDVKTVPAKRESSLQLQIASEEETARKKRENTSKTTREFLVKVNTDKDLFDSNKGEIELWLSKDYVPVEGIIKGVVLVGDVHGTLQPRRSNTGS